MVTKRYEFGGEYYVVTTASFIEGRPYNPGPKTPRKAPQIALQGVVVTGAGNVPMTDFEQVYADELCNGNITEAREQIESDMIGLNEQQTERYQARVAKGRAFRAKRGRARRA